MSDPKQKQLQTDLSRLKMVTADLLIAINSITDPGPTVPVTTTDYKKMVQALHKAKFEIDNRIKMLGGVL